jgi:hypothetical protein
MWKIRFGNHESWAHGIASAVDRACFECQFGDLCGIDFSDFDCVVPLMLPDYDVLQNSIALFGKKFWCPNPRIVNICDDKLHLNQLLLRDKFGELVPPLLAGKIQKFPYIVKKRRDAWGTNSFVVRNVEEERALASIIESQEYFVRLTSLDLTNMPCTC